MRGKENWGGPPYSRLLKIGGWGTMFKSKDFTKAFKNLGPYPGRLLDDVLTKEFLINFCYFIIFLFHQ